MSQRTFFYALALACSLAGCGGGGSSTSSSPDNALPPTSTSPAPQAEPLQVLVPAYFYPLPGSPWEQLTRSAQVVPQVTITAIVNPSNGSGSKAEAPIAQALADFTQAGGKVLGYIPTGYGKRSAAEVRQHIERYFTFYGRARFSGFFLDEMSATSAQLAYYQGLYQDIKAIDAQLQVVGNPGTIPLAGYAGVADTLVTFEGPASTYAAFQAQPWLYQYSNRKQAMLVHDAASCTDMQSALRAAAGSAHRMGAVYATHRHFDYASQTGNPWAGLPTYWDSLVATVAALNQGRALPGC